MDNVNQHPTLYEFLLEAELSHYFNPFRNELKINSVAQIKYVEEEDLLHLGMSKPEQRRLKKFFHKYYPQTYLKKIKKMILSKNKDDPDRVSVLENDTTLERPNIKVPSKHIISMDNISLNKELGIGEFGVVQQGIWTNEDGERIQVAIKCLCKERMQNNNMEFLKEAAIMHTIDHEHIVRLYGVALDTKSLMLVTELAPLRSLLECLKEPVLRPSFGVLSLCEFAQQICDGMQYLENKRLIHRDLAARNILVFSKNKVKISDFGLSRALGVGKDYYQTNFNVNLKLPIAWCSPECINYLRFTSASDVWAYGVTLWEMFSYGFQPWAALTGQQILEAIDEPNFQRLEQPDCCPKEYYSLMKKCWQHDPSKRPKFSEIAPVLPEYKPEQVQAIKDCNDILNGSKVKKDTLQYKVGDIITVLDKKPISENSSCNFWKGVTNNGKTGLFNPANTVTYLGRNLPTNHATFSRAESKSGLYSSRRRLCRDMISRPQGDFKHTGHVGLDGAFFGDISFLGEKYHQLPKQVVTPYKPQDDKEKSNLSLNKIPSTEKFPLFNRSSSMKIVSSNTWTAPSHSDDYKDKIGVELSNGTDKNTESEENEFGLEFSSLDLGPSLMEEVFKALGKSSVTEKSLTKENNSQETSKFNEILENDLKEILSEQESDLVESNSIKNEELLNSKEEIFENTIEIKNEKSINSLTEYQETNQSIYEVQTEILETSQDKKENSFDDVQETTINSNSEINIKDENNASDSNSQTDIKIENNSLDSLNERTNGIVSISSPIATCSNYNNERLVIDSQKEKLPVVADSTDETESSDPNPLRMLRSGMPVRPKVRGNKHSLQGNSRISSQHNSCTNTHSVPVYQVGGRTTLGEPPPPPPPSLSSSNAKEKLPIKDKIFFHSQESVPSGDISPDNNKTSFLSFNPLPLPPRDRSKPFPLLKYHQRKHPLVLPGQSNLSVSSPLVKQTSCPDVMACSAGGYGETLQNRAASDDGMNTKLSDFNTTNLSKSDHSSLRFTTFGHGSNNKSRLKVPPPKPSRVYNKDDKLENQTESEIDNLDNIPEEENCSSLSKNNFNSQDNLAKQKNISQRIQHSDKNWDAKEVHIIQRILKDE